MAYNKLMTTPSKINLRRLYFKNKHSTAEIAKIFGYSENKINYWLRKYKIKKRSISEAIYTKNNLGGDPFKIKKLKTRKDIELFNLGVGLFLGEGTKRSKYSVVLANSNPKILKLFLEFLRDICRVNEGKIKAALNIFDDIDIKKAINFWNEVTGISISRFSKTIIRASKGGTYKNKSRYGTLTLYVSNTKLKALMDNWCENALSRL